MGLICQFLRYFLHLVKGANNHYNWKVDVNATGFTGQLIEDIAQGMEEIFNLRTDLC